MQSVDKILQLDNADEAALRRMVGPDAHRPWSARARLLAEQIPVWAIIGHLQAVARTSAPAGVSDAVIAEVADDYAISREAVLAALLYYREHRGAIDALLEANATALA